MGAAPIYHICGREEWQAAPAAGRYGVWGLPLGPDSRHVFPAAVLRAGALE